jgi:hypothetical protein
MKNGIVLFFVLMLMCSSCSNSDGTSFGLLVKKIVSNDGNGNKIITDYVYDGNKLVSISNNNGIIIKYLYTGNLITNTETYINSQLTYETQYVYNMDKVQTIKTIDLYDFSEHRAIYTYNIDNTVDIVNSKIDLVTATETINSTEKLFYSNGNVMKHIFTFISGTQFVSTSTYVYDEKNNPFKNVLGNSILQNNSINNELSVYRTSSQSGSTSISSTYTTTYNTANFPTKRVYHSGNITATYEYFY